jgi:hypothetical protein
VKEGIKDAEQLQPGIRQAMAATILMNQTKVSIHIAHMQVGIYTYAGFAEATQPQYIGWHIRARRGKGSLSKQG